MLRARRLRQEEVPTEKNQGLCATRPCWEDGKWLGAKKEKIKSFWWTTHTKKRPGPDSPNAMGWYGRLRRPISPLSVLSSESTLTAIFSCVALSWKDCSLLRIIVDYWRIRKETYEMNLNAVTLSIWSFRIPTAIFGIKVLYNPGLLPFPLRSWRFLNLWQIKYMYTQKCFLMVDDKSDVILIWRLYLPGVEPRISRSLVGVSTVTPWGSHQAWYKPSRRNGSYTDQRKWNPGFDFREI